MSNVKNDYRFGSAIGEVWDFVRDMLVGECKGFNFDEFTANEGLSGFRVNLHKVAVRNGWMFKTRAKAGGLWVKRIK